jgi:hypothetical protein
VILSRTRGLDIKILGTQGYDAGLGIRTWRARPSV